MAAHIERPRSQRLDQYVIEQRPRLSRGYAVRLIEGGDILVNGQIEKPGYKLRATDTVVINFEETNLDIIPHIELPVLFEDDNVIVINKPAGVISHARGRYWDEPSVASFIRSKVATDAADEEHPGQPTRAGIVHRLDRATSGVMICAKSPETLKFLQKQFGDRTVTKTYVAAVNGQLVPDHAIIDMPIGRNPKAPSTFRVDANGKSAVTSYKVLRQGPDAAVVELTPKTGRTHQLRVHLAHQGHPIIGDTLYNGQPAERLYLHAASLQIMLPGSNELTTFSAPLPDIFDEVAR